jgi:hypothetical protein
LSLDQIRSGPDVSCTTTLSGPRLSVHDDPSGPVNHNVMLCGLPAIIGVA